MSKYTDRLLKYYDEHPDFVQPPIDTPEETSAIPFKKMKPKNEAYHIPRIEKSDCTIK